MTIGTALEWVLLLLCLLVFLASTVNLLAVCWAEKGRSAEDRINNLVLKLLEIPHALVDGLLGPGRFALRGLLIISLFYWVALPSLAILFHPVERPQVTDSWGFLIALHLWIWPNIFGDWLGLVVTRLILRALLDHKRAMMESGQIMNIGVVARSLAKDMAAALVLIVVIILTTNFAGLLQIHQNWPAAIDNICSIFSVETTLGGFSLVEGGATAGVAIPGKFLIAITSFIPIFLWVSAIIVVYFSEILALGKISAKRRQQLTVGSVLGLWLTSFYKGYMVARSLGLF